MEVWEGVTGVGYPLERTQVFVYGTLKKGGAFNNVFTEDCRLVEDRVILPGYGLLDLGDYPGMIPCDNACVLGEVWDIPYYLLQELDAIEGVEQGLYTRKWIDDMQAWAYEYTWVEYEDMNLAAWIYVAHASDKIKILGSTFEWINPKRGGY